MRILNGLITILMTSILCVVLYFINDLNIFPKKYILLLILAVLIIAIIFTALFLLIDKFIGNLLVSIVEIIIIVLAILLLNKIQIANSFFNNIKEVEEQSIYYVMVLKDTEYNDIKDLKDKKIATFKYKSDSYIKAIDSIKKEIEFEELEYEDSKLLITDLLNKNIDAIIINSINKDIIDENDEEFKNNTKIIKEISIEEVVKREKKEQELNKPINILVSGIDIAGSINLVSRSDVNIIITVNPNTHEVVLTSIPRDTYVWLHGIGGVKDKLTHSGIYGINMTETTIEDFLGIDIDYYIRVNFTTLERVVDAIGGVDVYSDQTFSEYGFTYYRGMNHLNGKQALYYSRIRHVFAEGDRKRGEHQKQVLEAIITKVASSNALLTNFEATLSSLSYSFQTNIPSELIKHYVKEQLDKSPSWKFESIAINGDGQSGTETYSMPGWKLYVMIPYQDSINYCSNMINGVIEGKKIDELK